MHSLSVRSNTHVIHRIGGLEITFTFQIVVNRVIYRIGGLETKPLYYVAGGLVIHRIGGLEKSDCLIYD